LGEGDDHLDRGVRAPARLDHLVPPSAGRVRQQGGLARQQLREEAHVVGMVGHDQKVERSGQLHLLAAGRRDLLAAGQTIGVGWVQTRAEGARVERDRSVEVRIAEERARGEVAARVRRVGRLPRRLLGGRPVEGAGNAHGLPLTLRRGRCLLGQCRQREDGHGRGGGY
jgi:hypothetical protein